MMRVDANICYLKSQVEKKKKQALVLDWCGMGWDLGWGCSRVAHFIRHKTMTFQYSNYSLIRRYWASNQ